MQQILFLANDSALSGLKAVAPIVYQESIVIPVGAGATATDLLAQIPAGECAAYGGQVVNKGCYDLLATIQYLDGADCDSCTVDTLALVPVEVIIPANSVFPLPLGFYQQISVVTVDSSEATVSNTTEVKLKYYSTYQPPCGGCPLAI
jgi:hypothetical protein